MNHVKQQLKAERVQEPEAAALTDEVIALADAIG
jgi:hypothetical protein